MSYRNQTYVIFDGDNDLWAYAYLKGWKQSEHIQNKKAIHNGRNQSSAVGTNQYACGASSTDQLKNPLYGIIMPSVGITYWRPDNQQAVLPYSRTFVTI